MTRQDVLLKIAAMIAEHQAEIALPTRTLHLHQEAPDSTERVVLGPVAT